MKIHLYLSRLYDILLSRGEIEIEAIHLDRPVENQGIVAANLRFYDGSLLSFDERVRVERNRIVKIEYRYHYQDADGVLIFRYDNAPHHPKIATYPNHLHVGERVEAAEPPDLGDVLRRIDELLYSTGQQDGTPSEEV